MLPSGCGPKKSQPSTNDVYRPEHCLRRVPCGWVWDSVSVSIGSVSGLFRVWASSESALCRFAGAAEGAADLARYRNASNDKWFKIYYRSQVALFPTQTERNAWRCIPCKLLSGVLKLYCLYGQWYLFLSTINSQWSIEFFAVWRNIPTLWKSILFLLLKYNDLLI